MPSARSFLALLLAVFLRTQVWNVWPSSCAARAAVQGASAGTFLASASSRA